MLKIYYGDMPGVIYNTSMYFDNRYLDHWIEDEFSKKIIKSVDKAIVLGPQAIDSKALGVIPVTQLSGGTKTLLLMYKEPEQIYNASTCGDNCAKWILRIARNMKEDLTINLHHIMDFGDGTFEICILNTGVIVHDMKELICEAGGLLE